MLGNVLSSRVVVLVLATRGLLTAWHKISVLRPPVPKGGLYKLLEGLVTKFKPECNWSVVHRNMPEASRDPGAVAIPALWQPSSVLDSRPCSVTETPEEYKTNCLCLALFGAVGLTRRITHNEEVCTVVLQMQCGPALFAQGNQNLVGESPSYLDCCLWSAEKLGSSGDDVRKKFPY